tara:strand:+ start:1458 stop:1742 length:285 start_codon:yes stop_codon:yes gene_type:complete
MNDSTKKKKEKSTAKTFESSFSELESVVRKLEAGGLSLDEATSLYETGMNLATKCNEILSKSELKITNLQANFSKQMNLLNDSLDTEDLDNGES